MLAFALGLFWVAYSAILYGYILVHSYNVGFKQLFSPVWPPVTSPAQ